MAKVKGRTRRDTAGHQESRPALGHAAAAGAQPLVAEDSLLFCISWAEQNEHPTLTELRYNDACVVEERVVAPGKITVSFKRPISAIHRFAWDLLIKTPKLHNLDAAAAVGGAATTSLKSAKDAKDRWADQGDL
jgi:hypothetical protein